MSNGMWFVKVAVLSMFVVIAPAVGCGRRRLASGISAAKLCDSI
jgi:hypothetical protein